MTTATEIQSQFISLSDREQRIGKLLQSSRKQRGMPGYDPRELLQLIREWSRPLKEVPTYALGHCFDRAIAIHNPQSPFEVAEVVRVWREMSETTRNGLYESSAITALPPGPPCAFCNNGGLMRVRVVACRWPRLPFEPIRFITEPVKWESCEETQGMKPCACRQVQTENRQVA
jgi:hypothetical protein